MISLGWLARYGLNGGLLSMRTKVKAIIKLSFILLAVVIMAIACFVPMQFGFTKWKGFAADIKLSTDLKGGVYAVYQVAADESTDNLD